MTKAAVAQLKAQLSHYLRRVKAGEEVIVTERGVPVARIVPIGSAAADDEHLQDIERQGLIRVGTGKLPKGFWKLPRPRDRDASVRRAVAEERNAGW